MALQPDKKDGYEGGLIKNLLEGIQEIETEEGILVPIALELLRIANTNPDFEEGVKDHNLAVKILRRVYRQGEISKQLFLDHGRDQLTPYEHSYFILNRKDRQLEAKGRKQDLTNTEYSLISLLASNENIVLERQNIINAIWGETGIKTNVLDVFVGNLRRKMNSLLNGQVDPSKIIKTHTGVGYELIEPIKKAQIRSQRRFPGN